MRNDDNALSIMRETITRISEACNLNLWCVIIKSKGTFVKNWTASLLITHSFKGFIR